MNRLWGGSKPKDQKGELEAAIRRTEDRMAPVNVNIAQCNAELKGYADKMSKMRDGPAKTAIKKQAARVLERRMKYEKQLDQLQGSFSGLLDVQLHQASAENMAASMEAMDSATKVLKTQNKKFNLDKLDQRRDEWEETRITADEIAAVMGEALGNNYELDGEEFDAQLDAELAGMSEDAELDRLAAESEGNAADFMTEPPDFIDSLPESQGQVKEAAA